jgi:hypothetical protein
MGSWRAVTRSSVSELLVHRMEAEQQERTLGAGTGEKAGGRKEGS